MGRTPDHLDILQNVRLIRHNDAIMLRGILEAWVGDTSHEDQPHLLYQGDQKPGAFWDILCNVKDDLRHCAHSTKKKGARQPLCLFEFWKLFILHLRILLCPHTGDMKS